MNQTTDQTTSLRTEKEGPTAPGGVPAIPNSLHRKGLSIEGAEWIYQKNTMDSIRPQTSSKTLTISSMKSC